MRIIGSVVVAAAFLLGGASVVVSDELPKVVQYQLDNGLEVLLAPDGKVPKVGLALVYRVGGMNEPAGRSGFAHLFEHLMFSGTPEYPRIDDTYSALGVQNNAFTEEDRTVYVADALASALPVMLSVEADRMANLGGDVDQRELDLQRDVVKNEMRQTVLDSAGAPGMQALRAALFPAPHPYAEAVIGSIADLDAAQLDDVKGFFDTYYVPNNAVLALAGDFDVEAVKALIAETFGRVPRGADVAVPAAASPSPVALRLDFTDRVPSPMVVLASAGPSVGSKASTALTVAADLLGNYEYGVLRRELVNKGLATNASAGWDPGRLGGRFLISATAAPGVAPDTLEAALRQAVADFVAAPQEQQGVDRARQTLRIGRQLSGEAMLDRARSLATRFDLYGAASPGLGDDPNLLALTTADVEAAVRAQLAPAVLSVLTITPGTARSDYPAVLKDSSGSAVPIEATARPVVEVPRLEAGEPGRAKLPPMETATLSNGIRLVHYQTAGSPLLLLAASVTGGAGSDVPGEEGLIELTTMMMARGAGERGFEAFSKAAKDIGADISGQSGMEQSAIVLAVPPENLARGIDLMADAVQRPRFEQPEWDALKAEVQQGLAYRKMDPGALAYYAMEELAFPIPQGRAALEPTPAGIAALTTAEGRAIHHKLFNPRTMTIYSVGSVSLATVEAELERGFGGWSNDSPGIASVSHPSAAFADAFKVYVTPSAGNSQAIINLSRPAPAFNDPGVLEAIAVARLLGGDFTSRLNQVMRETKGYSYGVGASVWTNMPTGGMLTVSSAVAADQVGTAIADIRAGFAGLATIPVAQSELDRTIMATAGATAGSVETSSGLFGLVMSAASAGMTAEEMNGKLDEIVALQLPAVQAAAQSLAPLDRALVVIAGDPQSILPQLEAIGVTDVTVVPPAE
ncbi:M16 family metallopeptidase [Devosia sp.]|uniref:M16 family metallopeptidase n=1 Tax=Devosia sp. TaxID=1871048 RepID=UPI003F722CD1